MAQKEHEEWVRQGVHVVFKEPIYKIWDKLYYKKPLPMGGDLKK